MKVHLRLRPHLSRIHADGGELKRIGSDEAQTKSWTSLSSRRITGRCRGTCAIINDRLLRPDQRDQQLAGHHQRLAGAELQTTLADATSLNNYPLRRASSSSLRTQRPQLIKVK